MRALPSDAPRYVSSLRAKLLGPLVGLMLLSLLGSTLAFMIGTRLTQNRLLAQQTAVEAAHVAEALAAREQTLLTAAALLARDPNIHAALAAADADGLTVLHHRGVTVRDRFNLDLIQIYDQNAAPRLNLVVSSLYRESALLKHMPAEGVRLLLVEGRALLLAHTAMPAGEGVVIAGIDLEIELQRILTQQRLISELGLWLGDMGLSTSPAVIFDTPEGRYRQQYSQRLSLGLGAAPVQLVLQRPTSDIAHISQTGLMVMGVSALLTTAILIGLSVVVARAIAGPLLRFAETAARVARGDLTARVHFQRGRSPLAIGQGDEIGRLADTFNDMVAELQTLYGDLESKIAARTCELQATAEVMRAVSSSLELEPTLGAATRLIQEHLALETVGVFLNDYASGMTVLRAGARAHGAELQAGAVTLPIGSNTLIGMAAALGQWHTLPHADTDTLSTGIPGVALTDAVAAVPLLVGRTILGVLYAQSAALPAFDAGALALLATFADQIAVGVQNAQLYAQQKRAIEELAELDRLKTQFLANMSHELRTPLNSIIGFSKLLLKEIEGPLNAEQRQELQIIYDSGLHLLALINDVLDLSKINAGKLEVHLEAVAVLPVIDNATRAILPLLKDKPIALRLEAPEGLPPVYADPRRLRQVLLNLLSNAAKFTESGTIAIGAREVVALNAPAERLETFVEIWVQDTGIGIPQDKLGEIFQEFTQVDSSDARKAGGTGLGLPITRRLVELQGGQLRVESQLGVGSTFVFTLPVCGTASAEFADLFEKEKGVLNVA